MPREKRAERQTAGVGRLAVATPVCGGLCRHKTFPHSYRRVGGRYRQPEEIDKSTEARIDLSRDADFDKTAFGGR